MRNVSRKNAGPASELKDFASANNLKIDVIQKDDTTDEIITELDLNITGTVRAGKAVLPGVRAQKSALIIQVNSTAGRAAYPGFNVYHASKWGLEVLSEAWRYELSPLGIDVVFLEPGTFATNFFRNMVSGSDAGVASNYRHVNDFFAGFEGQVQIMFKDETAPTDAMIVVKTFEKLINDEPGTRPLRTIT